MDAGRLRNKVMIQTPTKTVGDGGQPLIAWSELIRAWADVNTESMKEVMQSERVQSKSMWIVRMRYNQSVNDTMRIIYNDSNQDHRLTESDPRTHKLNIMGITFDKRKRFQFCRCVEEV